MQQALPGVMESGTDRSNRLSGDQSNLGVAQVLPVAQVDCLSKRGSQFLNRFIDLFEIHSAQEVVFLRLVTSLRGLSHRGHELFVAPPLAKKINGLIAGDLKQPCPEGCRIRQAGDPPVHA
jgi:hypothetical protein